MDSPLAWGLGMSFEAKDAPYFIELQDPGSTQIRLIAGYGSRQSGVFITLLRNISAGVSAPAASGPRLLKCERSERSGTEGQFCCASKSSSRPMIRSMWLFLS